MRSCDFGFESFGLDWTRTLKLFGTRSKQKNKPKPPVRGSDLTLLTEFSTTEKTTGAITMQS